MSRAQQSPRRTLSPVTTSSGEEKRGQLVTIGDIAELATGIDADGFHATHDLLGQR